MLVECTPHTSQPLHNLDSEGYQKSAYNLLGNRMSRGDRVDRVSWVSRVICFMLHQPMSRKLSGMNVAKILRKF